MKGFEDKFSQDSGAVYREVRPRFVIPRACPRIVAPPGISSTLPRAFVSFCSFPLTIVLDEPRSSLSRLQLSHRERANGSSSLLIINAAAITRHGNNGRKYDRGEDIRGDGPRAQRTVNIFL